MSTPREFISKAEELRRTGELGEAIEVLEECVSQFPEYASAKVALARLYVEDQQWEKGLTLAEELLESDPQNMAVLKTAARSSGQLGLWEKAIHYNERLYELVNDPAILETIEGLKQEQQQQLPPSQRKVARLKRVLENIERRKKDE